MNWLLLIGLIFDGSGAFLLLISDLPEGPIKKAFYWMNPRIKHRDKIRRKLAEEWNRTERNYTGFENLSEIEKRLTYSVIRDRELKTPDYDITSVYFDEPYIVFDMNDRTGFKTPCYTSPRRMFEERFSLALSHFYSRIGAALLLIGFTIQIISVIL
jgi:hypothetical protein